MYMSVAYYFVSLFVHSFESRKRNLMQYNVKQASILLFFLPYFFRFIA